MHSSPDCQVGQQSWDKVKDHGRLELAGVASVHAAQRPLGQVKGPLWVGVAQDCRQQRGPENYFDLLQAAFPFAGQPHHPVGLTLFDLPRLKNRAKQSKDNYAIGM